MTISHSVSDFLDLSAALTGFDRTDLEGTGLAETFYNEVRRIIGGRIFGRLLVTWHQLHEEFHSSEPQLAEQLKSRILDTLMMGDVARNIISLWYVGNWNQMPLEWRQKYGASANDLTHVVSAEAYREGLVWRAIGAHPPTAKSPGFGTWFYPPEDADPLDDEDREYLRQQFEASSARRSGT
jgi:hypothetical protein